MNDSGIGKANNIKFNNHVYNWQFLSFFYIFYLIYFVVSFAERKFPEFTTQRKTKRTSLYF